MQYRGYEMYYPINKFISYCSNKDIPKGFYTSVYYKNYLENLSLEDYEKWIAFLDGKKRKKVKKRYQENRDFYKKWAKENKDKVRIARLEWFKKNRYKYREQKNKYYKENEEYRKKRIKYAKDYNERNKEIRLEYQKGWYYLHREERIKYQREYRKRRQNIGNTQNEIMKGGHK